MNEKKKMKGLPKRVLSFVLTLAMMLTLMPMFSTTVYAEPEDWLSFTAAPGSNGTITINGESTTSETWLDTKEGNTFIVNGDTVTYNDYGGNTVTLIAVPDEGYVFDKWTSYSYTISDGNEVGDIVANFKIPEIPKHTHIWNYSVNGATLVAKCTGEGDCTVTNGKTDGVSLTLTADSANYSGTSVPVTVTAQTGFPVAKTESNVVYYESDGTTLVPTTNSGAGEAGKAPKLAGTYVAKLTITTADGATEDKTASITYTIGKADITSVTFTEPTAPVANATPASTVVGLGSNYTGTIVWAPASTTFGYSTAYTATITLTAADNYKFKSDVTIPTNWTKSATSTDTSLVLTRTYTATEAAPHTCGSGVKQDGQAATCTADGFKDYYKCCGCDKLYEEAACTNEISYLATWKATDGQGKIAALGHEWGYNASGATLTATCNRDASHTATLTLTATSANYSGNTLTYGDATVSPAKDIGITGYNAWVSAVSTPIVEFSSDNGATWSGTAPTNLGNYKMRVYPAVESENPTNIATKDFSVGILSWNSLQTALNNQSEIKLSGDITAVEGDHPITITREVTIDLNGYTLNANAVSERIGWANYEHAISVETDNAKLIVKDTSTEKTGKIQNDADAIYVKDNGSFTMEGGTISAEGVGVAVEGNGSFIMKGGSIAECYIGVNVDGGYFNMKDGASIINNSDMGVSFCNQNEDQEIGFLMEGGTISDNGSQGVMIISGDYKSVFTMTGGPLSRFRTE